MLESCLHNPLYNPFKCQYFRMRRQAESFDYSLKENVLALIHCTYITYGVFTI